MARLGEFGVRQGTQHPEAHDRLVRMAAAGKDVRKQSAKNVDRLSKAEAAELRREAPNPVWFKPLMFGFMLLGLVWIIVYYITSTTPMPLPIPALGQGNLFVGFGLVLVGFMMTPWWK